MSNSSSSRCAACKYLRRRCHQDCVLAPYFPSTNPQRFVSVHKIFGASNITKILQQLPVHYRAEAADCMSFEATSRIEDPVYGCVGIISQLQQQIILLEQELAKAQCQLAFYSPQQAQHQQQQQQHQQQKSILAEVRHGEPSWFSASQNETTFYSSQQVQQQQQRQQLTLTQTQYGEPPWLSTYQKDPFYYLDQQLLDFNQQDYN